MFGWRCKLGLIVPIDNAIIEPELNVMAPDGVTVNTTRLRTMELPEMPADAVREANHLATMGADVIAYACNASSFYDGVEGNRRIVDRLEDAADLPVTTASKAMAEGLQTVGATTLAVVTPYGESDNERLAAFLKDHDLEVASMSSLGLASDEADDLSRVNEETADDTYRRVVDADTPDADAVLVTATNLASIRRLKEMEADVGKPVVSTNQAMLWHALELSGVSTEIGGYGQLLDG